MSPYESEETLSSGVRCLISNRLAYGLSALKMGTFFRGMGGGDNKTATLADFSPATTGGMEKHFLNNIDMFPAGRYPFSVDFMKRTIRSRNLVFPMVCGEEHYPGR